jgi:hypothetical protein
MQGASVQQLLYYVPVGEGEGGLLQLGAAVYFNLR